jgi:hypothetical protein
MMSRSFGEEFFGSLRYRIMSPANRDILTVSLHICIPFISSSCLNALARNFRTIETEVGKVGTLVLFLILEEMASVFLH